MAFALKTLQWLCPPIQRYTDRSFSHLFLISRVWWWAMSFSYSMAITTWRLTLCLWFRMTGSWLTCLFWAQSRYENDEKNVFKSENICEFISCEYMASFGFFFLWVFLIRILSISCFKGVNNLKCVLTSEMFSFPCRKSASSYQTLPSVFSPLSEDESVVRPNKTDNFSVIFEENYIL